MHPQPSSVTAVLNWAKSTASENLTTRTTRTTPATRPWPTARARPIGTRHRGCTATNAPTVKTVEKKVLSMRKRMVTCIQKRRTCLRARRNLTTSVRWTWTKSFRSHLLQPAPPQRWTSHQPPDLLWRNRPHFINSLKTPVKPSNQMQPQPQAKPPNQQVPAPQKQARLQQQSSGPIPSVQSFFAMAKPLTAVFGWVDLLLHHHLLHQKLNPNLHQHNPSLQWLNLLLLPPNRCLHLRPKSPELPAPAPITNSKPPAPEPKPQPRPRKKLPTVEPPMEEEPPLQEDDFLMEEPPNEEINMESPPPSPPFEEEERYLNWRGT